MDDCTRAFRHLVEMYRWCVPTPPTEVKHDAICRVVVIQGEHAEMVDTMAMLLSGVDPIELIVLTMQRLERAAGRD